MYEKILSQVPPDYYDSGVKSNFFQWLWHGWKFRNLESILKDLKGDILDVGCADGSLTAKLSSKLPKLKFTGIDMYKGAINYANSKWKHIKFVSTDARKLPFGSGKFDSILCVETLEHIPQNHLAVREFYRVLKKDGILVVCQDTDSWLFNFIWFFWTKWKGSVWNGAHVNCMKPGQIEKLLKDNGFEIENKKFSHFGLEVAYRAKKVNVRKISKKKK